MTAIPVNTPAGAAAVFAGARVGQPSAMYLSSLLHAAGFETPLDWGAALLWLQRAAQAGEPRAIEDLAVMQADEGLDLDLLLRPPPEVHRVLPQPLVGVAGRLMGPATCRWMIEHGAPFMGPAQIYLPGEEMALVEHRSNTAAAFDTITSGLPLTALRQRIAALLGVRVTQLEPTSILRYQIGEQYAEHHDYFSEDPVNLAVIAAKGQRIATLLVYLNTDYQGGETDFPRLGFNYRGQAGDALFWANLDANGKGEPLTLHAGRPPTQGTKWIISQWVRDRDQLL